MVYTSLFIGALEINYVPREMFIAVNLSLHGVYIHCLVNWIFTWDELPREARESPSFKELSDLTLKFLLF